MSTTALLVDGRRFLAEADTVERVTRHRLADGAPFDVISACGHWADEPGVTVWSSWAAGHVADYDTTPPTDRKE